jgi:integrase
LPEDNARQGFFEHADFKAVVSELPEDLRDFALWGYLCGWRKSEIAALGWNQFEMEARLMHLSGRETKNGEPRKIALEGELWEIIERRWKARKIEMPSGETIIAPLVFFRRHGRGVPGAWAPILEFRKAWKSACEAAGVPHKLFHDFRRTAARNLRRAGVSEEVAMLITGHKSTSMFRRYNITDENDLREAMRKAQAYVQTLPTERTVAPFQEVAERETV